MMLPIPHTRAQQAGAALLTALTLSLGLTACKSTPAAADDDTSQAQTITVTGPEDLLQTEDTLLSMRVRFGGELPGVMRTFLGGEPEVQIIAAFLEDPVSTLLMEPGVQVELSALDTERPAYINISSLGNEDFLQAASLGLPTRAEEWPVHALVRVLLPTDDTALMATQFDALIAEFNSDNADAPLVARSFEGPGFLRVELATVINRQRRAPGDPLELAQTWLDTLDLENLAPPAGAGHRATAAYNAYVDADSELALWTRFEALAMLGILESSISAPTNHRPYGGDAAMARYRMENLSRLALASVLSDPVAAENEDVSLHIDATEAGELFVDAVMTRTTQGARVGDAARSTLTLPQIAGDHFLALDWSIDLEALAETTIAPLWEIESTQATAASTGGLDSDDMFERISDTETAVPILTALAQYPMALTITSAFAEQALPLARGGTLRAFTLPQGGQLPVGAAGVFVFDNEPGKRDELQEVLSMLQSALPVGFDAAIIERDTDFLELRMALGSTLAELFDDAGEMQVSEAAFEFDLTKIDQLRAFIPQQSGLHSFDRISFASGDAEGYQSYRLGINVQGETIARTAENDAPLLTPPTFRCRTELAAAAFTNLQDLGSDAHARAERYFSTFSERAERCIEPTDPYAAEVKARQEMAREWAAELDDEPEADDRRALEAEAESEPTTY